MGAICHFSENGIPCMFSGVSGKPAKPSRLPAGLISFLVLARRSLLSVPSCLKKEKGKKRRKLINISKENKREGRKRRQEGKSVSALFAFRLHWLHYDFQGRFRERCNAPGSVSDKVTLLFSHVRGIQVGYVIRSPCSFLIPLCTWPLCLRASVTTEEKSEAG